MMESIPRDHPESIRCWDIYEITVVFPFYSLAAFYGTPVLRTSFICSMLMWFTIRLSCLYAEHVRNRLLILPLLLELIKGFCVTIFATYGLVDGSLIGTAVFILALIVLARWQCTPGTKLPVRTYVQVPI
jgi:hypothetical protein